MTDENTETVVVDPVGYQLADDLKFDSEGNYIPQIDDELGIGDADQFLSETTVIVDEVTHVD